MLDQLLDLFDRDRRSGQTTSGRRGLRGLLARVTGDDDRHDDDHAARSRQHRSQRDDAEYFDHDDDDGDDMDRSRSRRGNRDRFDLDD